MLEPRVPWSRAASFAGARTLPDKSRRAALFTLDSFHPPQAIAFGPGAPIREVAVNEASFIVREDGTSESWGANVLPRARVVALP